MSQAAQWTWLVYMAGDNNLEDAGREDLAEMKRVGSTAEVNILVQFDTEENETTRYRIEKNRAKVLQRLPGVDCGDPKVLTQFIQWGIKIYPAQHYLLDVWNHGGGWENLPADFDYDTIRLAKPRRAAKLNRVKRALFRTTVKKIDKRPWQERAIAIDCGSHDYLDNQELRNGVYKALPAGRKLDILGCDACLMNMLEIAYEMKETAAFMVGSEETEPGAGWPYAAILKGLVAKPTMSPANLAKTIVTEYGKYYQKTRETATQSALDLAQIPSAAAAVNELVGVLLARDQAQKFEMPEYVDLADFAEQLAQRLPQYIRVAAAAKKLLTALSPTTGTGLVIHNATCGPKVHRAHGVSIYFPHKEDYSPDYSDLAFSKDGKWQTFLKALFTA
jgi:hypothetical protein